LRFTINGTTYDITKELVEQRLRNETPEAGQKHFVFVAGREFPVKQALRVGIGNLNERFTSGRARDILSQLGFQLIVR
jgi:5-methylcytosine-specific restriction protein B